MTRMRGVKPDLLRHEGLLDLEASTGLPIRLCFIGLLMCADREGRFQWKPRTLKAEIMPHDALDFGAVLDALATGDFVRIYETGGKQYGWIPGFTTHQRINNKEQKSVLPPPPDESRLHKDEASLHQDEASLHPCEVATSHIESGDFAGLQGKERKGKERKGKEGERKGREPAPPPAPAREEPLFVSDAARQAEEIVSAYPANGNRYAAVAAVLAAIDAGEDPAAMLRSVRAHAERRRSLTATDRRYCPGLDGYFACGRWRDNPAEHPWTIEQPGSPQTGISVQKKMEPPGPVETGRLSVARLLWPAMPSSTRWADLTPDQRARVHAATEKTNPTPDLATA